MKPYTVCGFYDETNQIFCHHVIANDDQQAAVVVATEYDDAVFTNIINGHLSESGGGIAFPGETLVDAGTVLCQPDVFGVLGHGAFDETDTRGDSESTPNGILRYQPLYNLACKLKDLWSVESELLSSDIDCLVELCRSVTPRDLIIFSGLLVIIEYLNGNDEWEESTLRQFPELIMTELDEGEKVYRYHGTHEQWEVYSIAPSGTINWAANVISEDIAKSLITSLNANKV